MLSFLSYRTLVYLKVTTLSYRTLPDLEGVSSLSYRTQAYLKGCRYTATGPALPQSIGISATEHCPTLRFSIIYPQDTALSETLVINQLQDTALPERSFLSYRTLVYQKCLPSLSYMTLPYLKWFGITKIQDTALPERLPLLSYMTLLFLKGLSLLRSRTLPYLKWFGIT